MEDLSKAILEAKATIKSLKKDGVDVEMFTPREREEWLGVKMDTPFYKGVFGDSSADEKVNQMIAELQEQNKILVNENMVLKAQLKGVGGVSTKETTNETTQGNDELNALREEYLKVTGRDKVPNLFVNDIEKLKDQIAKAQA